MQITGVVFTDQLPVSVSKPTKSKCYSKNGNRMNENSKNLIRTIIKG